MTDRASFTLLGGGLSVWALTNAASDAAAATAGVGIASTTIRVTVSPAVTG